MSNGIGRVWAVNAECGDEGRPNGVGPVWIENADQLGSKLPEPESGDAGKVLGVLNADGDIGWVVDQSGTLTQVQSDWAQTDSSQVNYIANKPNLATVATTGAYSDLSGTPTIPIVDQAYNAASSNAQSGVAVASAVSGKQDTISDLSTIRSGAAAGATAVQPGNLATVATSGSYTDLSNKPTIPTVDQAYSAVSTNAQSGVAVAQAIAAIPSASYTAGDGIDITSGEISAKVGNGLEIGTSLTPVITTAHASGNSDGSVGVTVMQRLGNTLVSAIGTVGITYTIQNLTDNNDESQAWSYVNAYGNKLYPAICGVLDPNFSGLEINANDVLVLSTTGVTVSEASGSIPAGAQFTYNLNDINTALSTTNWATISAHPENYALCVWYELENVPGYIHKVSVRSVGTYTTNELYDSGTITVMEATLGAIMVSNPLPASAIADAGKVLTVDNSGAAAWATAQGGSSYTAGDGIDITNDEIKVRVKNDGGSNPLKFTTQHEAVYSAELATPGGTPVSEGWKVLVDINGEFIRAEYDDQRNVTHIGFRYLWNRNDPNPLGMVSMSEDSTKHFDAKCHLLSASLEYDTTDLVATSDAVSDAFTAGWDASHSLYTYSLGSLVETTDDGDVFSVEFDVSGDQTGAFNAIAFSSSGSDYSGILETVQSSFLDESHVLALQGDVVTIVGETIPGGYLYVEVDQTFNGESVKPQSGFAVAEAINTARQVPAGSEFDGGKALVYDDSEGNARWADQSSASISRDGTALAVRLRNASGVNNSGLAVNTTETPTTITGVVSSGGPNSSYYATFTKVVALYPDADTINITGFESSIPSGVLGPIYAIVVDGSTWQSGTLTGGIVFDRETDDGLNLAYPDPRKASVITDPNDQYAASNFFENVNTFMVFGVSNDNLLYDYDSGNFYGPFIDEWKYNGLYSALDQYAAAMTQPSGDVEFEIPSRPAVSRGLYVSLGSVQNIQQVNSLPASPDANTLYLIPEA